MRWTSVLLAVGVLVSAGSCARLGNSDRAALAVLVEGTGTHHRPIQTQSPLAQKFFDQGLRLTFGYHMPEAVASFQEALRHDPASPMLHWGLALALGPNPNSRYSRLPDDPHGEARRAIGRARERVGSGGSLERELIEALFQRFDTDVPGGRAARDRAYLEAMRRLHEGHPDDPDIVTLLADAFMVTTPWVYWDAEGRPLSGTEETARALEASMERHPEHPGTNHLYIHLVEAGPEPERALEVAGRLEALMPGVGHVVHMPSHILVRLGHYEEAIAINERSIEADTRFLEAWGDRPFPKIGTYYLSAENHRRHAHDFIRYVAGIQGNYGRAIEAARRAVGFEREQSILHGPGQRTVATPWLVHKMFGRWSALDDEKRTQEGLPYLDGMWLFATGSASVARGERHQASDALERLHALRRSPGLESVISRFNPVAKTLRLASLALEGEILEAEGDLEGAIDSFAQAVEVEDGLSYIEPPDWPQPMRHYLGAALLAAGRATEAEQVYRRDLRWNQNNGWALHGLWKSLEAQGRVDEARDAERAFRRAWSRADVELDRSRF